MFLQALRLQFCSGIISPQPREEDLSRRLNVKVQNRCRPKREICFAEGPNIHPLKKLPIPPVSTRLDSQDRERGRERERARGGEGERASCEA